MKRRRPTPVVGTPRVSVVVPCYNYGHYLPQAVQSALDQGEVEVEVLIVDDASPDGSARIAQDLAARHANVRAVVHDQNRGHIATYNEGLAQVDGDYVLLLSADDFLAPGALARAVALMQRHPSVGLVYGWAPPFENEPPAPRERLVRWSVWGGSEWLGSICRRGKNPVLTPSAVMRRDVMDAMGGYDARLKHSADMLLWMRVAASWDIAHVEGAYQAFYRVHGANMHATEFAGWATDLRLRLETFDLFFAEFAQRVNRPRELFDEARRAIAVDALRMARVRFSTTEATVAELNEYLDFAVATCPALADDRMLLRLRARAASRGASPVGTLRTALLTASHDLRDRLAWRYWRRFGVYL